MSVGAVLRQKGHSVISLPPDALVAAAAEMIARRRIGAVVVSDGAGALVGLLSERDVVRGLSLHGVSVLDLPVTTLMTNDPQAVTVATSVQEAMEIMISSDFRHLPVVRENAVCGIISMRDLLRYKLAAEKADGDLPQPAAPGDDHALGRV